MHFADWSKNITGNDDHFEQRKIHKISQRERKWEKVHLSKKKGI